MKIVSCVIICQVGDCRFFPNINTSMPAVVTLRGWVGVTSRRVSVYIWDMVDIAKAQYTYPHIHTFTICCIGVRTYTNIVGTGQTLAFSYTGHTKNPICQSTSCQVSIEAPLHLVQVQGLSKLFVLLDPHPLAIRRPRPPPPPVSPEMEHAL